MSALPSTFVEEFHSESDVKNIKYSNLENTDLKLSNLGVGGGTFSEFYGSIDETEAISLIRKALKSGVNYIDTSPYYGHTYSESLIGKALVDVPRQAYHISTKVGRYGTSWADFFDHSAERIVKEFDKSLERLGLDYVDILFVHDVEFSPLQQILTEALPAVQSIVDKKKARYVGISGYPVSLLWEVVEKSPVKIDVVLTYSRDCLFDTTTKKYMSFFQSRHVGLINAGVTGLGLLTNEGPPHWHPASADLKDLCRNASLYCQEQGVELGKLAVHHAMQQPGHCSHLVGMKTLAELQCNLEVATTGLTEAESKILNNVKEKFFNLPQDLHWEGVEINAYRKYKEEHGLK
ncbi:L-galactose dehydrogenase-like [Homalodisca vitripennis]|uniref:L-galactose dehydrogenase-like n=1 Tax=Homalodisca vitripennis TaxID=197043 RepID=UPI001EEBFC69|nr:L-galactose dehydrogenase-like [Homalodisca vitripennis]XP_046669828.1 L-galactose dehydrogenase-like [Homalodisca vitripennis]